MRISSQFIESGEDKVTLKCKIIGFKTNIPEMSYLWLYKGMIIPESSHYKYSTSQSSEWDTVYLNIKELSKF